MLPAALTPEPSGFQAQARTLLLDWRRGRGTRTGRHTERETEGQGRAGTEGQDKDEQAHRDRGKEARG